MSQWVVSGVSALSSCHDIPDHEHPHDQFGINRGPAQVTVEGLHFRAHSIDVEETVNLSKHVIGRNVVLKIEDIKQLSRCRLSSHHRHIPQFPHT